MGKSCPPFNADGNAVYDWIKMYFGECVYTQREIAALFCGFLSIGCWLCAQMPQVIKNFRARTAESLSGIFLTVWLLGDVSNLIGCIFIGEQPFQTYLGLYFVIIDTILVLQMLYFTRLLRASELLNDYWNSQMMKL
eukprot:Partr_v1_DN28768_c1_g1_i1_m61801 putative PQ loop repeat